MYIDFFVTYRKATVPPLIIIVVVVASKEQPKYYEMRLLVGMSLTFLYYLPRPLLNQTVHL